MRQTFNQSDNTVKNWLWKNVWSDDKRKMWAGFWCHCGICKTDTWGLFVETTSHSLVFLVSQIVCLSILKGSQGLEVHSWLEVTGNAFIICDVASNSFTQLEATTRKLWKGFNQQGVALAFHRCLVHWIFCMVWVASHDQKWVLSLVHTDNNRMLHWLCSLKSHSGWFILQALRL